MKRYINSTSILVCIMLVLIGGAMHQIHGSISEYYEKGKQAVTSVGQSASTTASGAVSEATKQLQAQLNQAETRYRQAEAELLRVKQEANKAIMDVERYIRSLDVVVAQYKTLISAYVKGAKNIELAMDTFGQKVAQGNIVGGTQELINTIDYVWKWVEDTNGFVVDVNNKVIKPVSGKGAQEVDNLLKNMNMELDKARRAVASIVEKNKCKQ